VTRTTEGARIFQGPSGDPNGWLRRFVGVTDGAALPALDRCKEVLVAVTHWIPPLSEQPVSVETWKAHTPRWFVEACASPPTRAEAEEDLRVWRSLGEDEKARHEQERAWTFEDWIAWFDWSSDLRRSWLWWDGGTLDQDRFWIEVEVSEDPAALGTLIWMMRAAGARTVTEDQPGRL
jgi:hypothetical protein